MTNSAGNGIILLAHSVLRKAEGKCVDAGKVGLISDKMSQKIVTAAERIVTELGIEALTVRRILQELNITNRVFYNRFHNVDEVLEIVYIRTAQRVRESMAAEYDGEGDFFDYVTDCVANTLVASYEIKMRFNQYVFENDSVSQFNYEWYLARIKELFAYAKEKGLIKDVDADVLSYAIWCFCRGYNADAVARMPKEEAIEKFKYSFRFLLEGLKK